MVPATVEDLLAVAVSLGVLSEETPMLLAVLDNEIGAGESWEPTLDWVEDAVVLDSVCLTGHPDTA